MNCLALAGSFRQIALRCGWESHALNAVGDLPRPWFRRPASQANAPRLYLSAGTHGDEPGGSLAVRELLRHPEWFRGFEVFLFPLINPVGLTRNCRENADGIDLNRDYRQPRSAEVAGHIAALEALPACHLHLHLHEDWEATGAYFYHLAPDAAPGLRDAIRTALAAHLPIDPATEIDGFPARDGVIDRADLPDYRDRPDWPEPLYLMNRHGTYYGCTIETPSSFPLARRIAAQVAAVRAAADFLRTNRLAFGPD